VTYDELKIEYEALADNDPAGAFRLMNVASGLIERFETEKNTWQQDADNQEVHAKYLEAKTALDSNESASKGALIAKANDAVLQEWKEFNRLIFVVNINKTKINYLVRVYFDCKDIWLKGERDVSSGRFSGRYPTSANPESNPVRSGQKEWR
jgi:hypothetical protein